MENKWRATIVFYSMEAIGHINPILPIAKELGRRGFRAIILTTAPLTMGPKLEAMGFELDHCENLAEADLETHSSQQKMRYIVGQHIGDPQGMHESFMATYSLGGVVHKYLKSVEEKYDLIEAKLRSMKPDLIVVDQIIAVPCVTQTARRWVRSFSPFTSILYSICNDNFVAGFGLKLDEMTDEMKRFEVETKSTLREEVRKFCLDKGCQDWDSKVDLAPTSPYLNFYFGPKELGLENIPTLKPLPDTWFRLEHTIDESDVNEFRIPENLENRPGKLIYFSLGTLFNCDFELINRLLETLSKSPNRFIISMGQMHEHIVLHPNMWGDKYIDQRAVLSKVDLFITHGGHNSTMEAFFFGVPGLIVLPLGGDQFDCAQRISDCGLGIRLDPYRCSSEELLGSIDRVLADETLKQKMQSIGQRLRSIKYHKLAADKLEDLLRE